MRGLIRMVALGAVMIGVVAFTVQAWDRPAANALAAGTPVAGRCGGAGISGTPDASPVASQATPSPVASADLTDIAGLIAALEARGLTVEDAGPIEQPFFSPTRAIRLTITGDALSGTAELQVYEYAETSRLAADAAQVGPDGNLRTVMIEWIAAPHFYCGERIMVIYLGDDEAALDLLTSLFGPQFAGR